MAVQLYSTFASGIDAYYIDKIIIEGPVEVAYAKLTPDGKLNLIN